MEISDYKILTDGKMKNFDYKKRCEEASEEQGITAIVAELGLLNISATSDQTGGFTMCAYIPLDIDVYIYANSYGASLYNLNDYEEDIIQFDEPQKAQIIAQEIKKYLEKVGA